MSQSITLQTSDTAVVSGDNIGRLSFAASSEASAGDSVKIAASIYAEAEAEFTSTANSTSLVFATAASDNASGQYKITSIGHFEPFVTVAQNLGSEDKKFNILYVDNIKAVSKGITLTSNTPAITTDTLYNVGGSLYFNGSPISGGTSSGTTSYDWKLSANSGATLTITSGTTVNFTGLGNITVSRNGSDIRISGSSSQSSGGGTPGGANTNIQYNSLGSFAGDSSLIWNYGTKELAVSGRSTLNSTGTGVVFQVNNTGSNRIFSVTDSTETNFTLLAQVGQTGRIIEVKDSIDTVVYHVDFEGNVNCNSMTGNNITLPSTSPSYTVNKLYGTNGILFYNGTGVAGGLNNVRQGTGVFNVGTLNNRATTTGVYTVNGLIPAHNIVLNLETPLPYGPAIQSSYVSGNNSLVVVWANYATGNITLGNVAIAYIAWY